MRRHEPTLPSRGRVGEMGKTRINFAVGSPAKLILVIHVSAVNGRDISADIAT